LEALARLLVAVLFPFDHARIAGQEVVVAEIGFEVGAQHLQRAGEAERHGAGLAVLAAARDVDGHVDPARHLGADERRADVVALDFEREIGVDFQVVHLERARAFTDAYAGDGGLAPAGAPDKWLLSRRGHRVVSPRVKETSLTLSSDALVCVSTFA